MEPTSQQQQMICSYLFELGVVAQCKPPNGDTMILPTAAPLSPTRYAMSSLFYPTLMNRTEPYLYCSSIYMSVIHTGTCSNHLFQQSL